MAAADYDLYIEQGATFRFTMVYTYKTGAKDVDGNDVLEPYDITNCRLRMQIRQRRGDQVLISATTSNGGIEILDALAGKFQVTITDEATDTLTMSRAKYDLEIGFPSGDVIRMMQGQVKISANITQDSAADNIAPAWMREGIDEQDVDKDDLVTDQPSTA